MKANHLSRCVLAFGLSLTAAACSAPQVIPSPAPASPTPRPRPAQPAQPATPPPANWQDAPQTPGDWRWSAEGGRSTARFGAGPDANLVSFTCDRAAGAVLLSRQAAPGTPAGSDVTLTISTYKLDRAVAGRVASGAIVASFGARDTFLDAIAFSRGRFAVQAPNLPPLYLPSWPEISRVLEDCR